MKINETPVTTQTSGKQADPVIIRGHTLLCLQGFRGEGYSPDFVDNMAAIHSRLQSEPRTPIRVTDTPDQFCWACPNLKGGCTLRGPDFEQHIVFQDRQVLELLGLKAGQEVTWAEVLTRIGSRMQGDMLDGICGDCQWLALGYCKEGIEQLRHTVNSIL
ncbi:MAG: DUF1284 domain-containing protein [Nitrospiria bacterium]